MALVHKVCVGRIKHGPISLPSFLKIYLRKNHYQYHLLRDKGVLNKNTVSEISFYMKRGLRNKHGPHCYGKLV